MHFREGTDIKELITWPKQRDRRTSYASLWKARDSTKAYDGINISLNSAEPIENLDAFRQRYGATEAAYTLEDDHSTVTLFFESQREPIFFGRRQQPFSVTHLRHANGAYHLERVFKYEDGRFQQERLSQGEEGMIVDPLTLTPPN